MSETNNTIETGATNIKTDAGIAEILKRLKESNKNPVTTNEEIETDETEQSEATDTIKLKTSELADNAINTVNAKQLDATNIVADSNIVLDTDVSIDADNEMLPWFTTTDTDNDYFNYATFGNNGQLIYHKIKINASSADIATLSLTKDFACNVTNYKPVHTVFFAQSFSCNSAECSLKKADINAIEITNTEFINSDSAESTSDLLMQIACTNPKYHYIVFTDLGVADFISDSMHRPEYVSDPSTTSLTSWFNDISNQAIITNANFDSYKMHTLSDAVQNIKDFKYDIITMHRPGVITLDSSDDINNSCQFTLKLKDVYDFISMSNMLMCLKHFASSQNKSINDFRHFINQYFDVITK